MTTVAAWDTYLERVKDEMRIHSAIVTTPTTPTDDFPHGGDVFGGVSDISFEPVYTHTLLKDPGTGKAYDGVEIGLEELVVGFLLHDWDSVAMTELFPGVVSGLATGKIAVRNSITDRVGDLLSDRAVKMLVSPADTENHPALYFPRAVPLLRETMELAHEMGADWEVPALFLALPDDSGVVMKYEQLETLSL